MNQQSTCVLWVKVLVKMNRLQFNKYNLNFLWAIKVSILNYFIINTYKHHWRHFTTYYDKYSERKRKLANKDETNFKDFKLPALANTWKLESFLKCA